MIKIKVFPKQDLETKKNLNLKQTVQKVNHLKKKCKLVDKKLKNNYTKVIN